MRDVRWRFTAALVLLWLGAGAPVSAEVIPANPSDYQAKVANLKPGDTLELAPGAYTRLNLKNLHGEPGAWITISGPESGDPAVIQGESCCNTVQLGPSSYLVIKNLTVDSLGINYIDGINAKSGVTHDIVIENNRIVGVGPAQATVGISTKSTAWNWVIRNNEIIEPGTGMYLGNSTGGSPFIAGVVEGNFILNSTGYCIEIKHQNEYSKPDAPAGPNKTIIRNNVLMKDDRPSDSGDRPNLLVGTFPTQGQGSNDLYEIYGNFIFNNPRENLLQATGRVAIHDNVFVGMGEETAIYLTNHNGPLKLAYVYNNTIFGGERGIRFANGADDDHQVVGNLIFADSPISGNYQNARDNISDTAANAGNYVTNPSATPGNMDFYPREGQCQGDFLDYPTEFLSHTDHGLDFNRDPKGEFTFRGAYAGEGTNPGWALSAARKDEATDDDPPLEPPSPPQGVSVD